ncbi:RNA 2',3'-cyclic phosphodiesterase [Nocardioides sp. JQ2195]|uniref:RNA 2',3'-cyclic phosphodiesterase n=1 Tax=Nocardioides sp. JQ2195 TaxID=2592334 RepID=UPI00143E0F2E|nr:RNA 2',3'-cyclic phosphodiesterase [Nocardioides sp. JQ2195]QIX25275.1 RNA 2',3'-cyclic phosphodiesterase [Nocardioides sp. JQ2195]
MRLFVAVVPPVEAIDHLDTFVEPRRAAADFRWAAVDQWHLTLTFMPQVDPWRIDDLVARLGEVAGRRASFRLTLRGGGAFPNPARAKVLWCGVGGETDALASTAAATRNAANAAGAVPSGGPFRAHLTLGRLGRPSEISSWVRLLDAYEGPSWTVHELGLVASHLGEGPRRRPRHEVIATVPLAQPPKE